MKKRRMVMLSIILILVVGVTSCITTSQPSPTLPAPKPSPAPTPEAPAPPATPVLQPKVWERLAPGEHEVALNVCASMVRARLTGLATCEDAFDYVESFLTHLTTCLSANGDSAGTINGEERHIQCPENAWHLVIYGMIPTGEITEMQIDDTMVPMMKYDVPDNWSRAVWLIYTDGTVEPYYNEYDKSDAAFKVEQDISKLNNGIELDFDWRR